MIRYQYVGGIKRLNVVHEELRASFGPMSLENMVRGRGISLMRLPGVPVVSKACVRITQLRLQDFSKLLKRSVIALTLRAIDQRRRMK